MSADGDPRSAPPPRTRFARNADGSLPLQAHAAIGNLRGAALVGADGAVVWCCLPTLDRPSLHAALLDRERGGRWRIAPAGVDLGDMAYLPRSNVLQTTFDTGDARLLLTDFMPIGRRGDRLRPGPPELHRLLEACDGDVDVELEWSPRFDYARGPTGLAAHDGGWLATRAGERAALAGVPRDARTVVVTEQGQPTLRARFRLAAGARVALVLSYGALSLQSAASSSARRLHATLDAWRYWDALGHPTAWAGAHGEIVRRSALALKLLCHADTGGIAAALTTSLPEAIGGERNWDYRYVWMRDASMTVEALLGAGHEHEVHAFLEFIERAERAANPRGPWLQLVFGLHGETELPEVKLEHLAGYRGSRPVRTGNGIASHRGHDIYEQLLGAGLEYAALGQPLAPRLRRFFARVADIACDEWRKPDHGIWELPDGPRHYVHSKWSVACALQHALQLARDHGVDGDTGRWVAEADAVRADVLARGWNAERGAFRFAYDLDALDAANVLMPLLGFLPADDARVAANLERTLDELVVDDLCYRYRVDDGLRGEEGCFVACTFWIVEALVAAGELRRARGFFERASARLGPLGLWSEQIDVRDGTHLGNLPQAFSHVAFLDAALRLAHAEGRDVPVVPDPAGIGAPRRDVHISRERKGARR